jgi:hypothetical protein
MQMPMPFRSVLCCMPFAALLLAAAATPARADYPYTGYWDNPDEGTPMEDVARRCALSFIEQRNDGRYNAYVLDEKLFSSQGEVVYRRFASGVCVFEASSQIESCHSTVDLSDRANQTYLAFDVLTSLKPDRIDFAEFDSLDEARAAIADGSVEDSGALGAYVRCPLSPELLQRHSTIALSTAEEDDIISLTNPDDDTLHGGFADEVMKALTGK